MSNILSYNDKYNQRMRKIRIDKMKIKNKNYVQSNTMSITQIKRNSKDSFEKLIDNNEDFDDYINKNYTRMLQQQSENPNLIIPKKFRDFVNSKLFKELLKKIYEYMLLVEQFEQKYKQIVTENKLKMEKLLIYESNLLSDKCKEISFIYMGILLSYGESKFMFKDQYFFETMIYFLSELLKENFEEQVYPIIDEQLNRMFRTNTFNLIKRRYEEDVVIQKYPDLKDFKYLPTPQGDQRLINRLKVHKKFRYAVEISPQKKPTIPKPLNISQSASKSIYSRSPLIASFYPSSRQKLYNFSRQQSDRGFIVSTMHSARSSSFTKG